jgi:hypothetical protein
VRPAFSISVVLASAGLLVLGCATVPRRAEVTSLASRILACPDASIRVRVAAIDALCVDRSQTPEGQLGPCLTWMTLGEPVGHGWIVEGCGQLDRFASPCGDQSSPMPAEAAFSGAIECTLP